MTPTPSSERDELSCRCWDDGALLYSYLCPIHGEAEPELVAILDPEPQRWLSNSGATSAKMGDIYAAIHHQTQIAQVRYALEVLEKLEHLIQEDSHNRFCETCQTPTTHGCRVTNSDIKLAIQAQQTRLDELSKGEK